MALIAKIDRTYVSGLERSIRNPSVGLLDKLAAAPSIKTVEFFSETGIDPPPPPLARGRRQKREKPKNKKASQR